MPVTRIGMVADPPFHVTVSGSVPDERRMPPSAPGIASAPLTATRVRPFASSASDSVFVQSATKAPMPRVATAFVGAGATAAAGGPRFTDKVTNPFFPLPHGLQGNRILELLATHPIETYLLNTGRVGGKDGYVGRDGQAPAWSLPGGVQQVHRAGVGQLGDDDARESGARVRHPEGLGHLCGGLG